MVELVEIPEAWRQRSEAFGIAYAIADAAGLHGNAPDQRISKEDVERLNTVGKAGECAAAIHYDLDPATALEWNAEEPDRGWDLETLTYRFDFKSSDNPRATCLIWPRPWSIKPDVLGFVRVADDLATAELVGWIYRRVFIQRCWFAPEGPRGAILTDGTPYMNTLQTFKWKKPAT